MRAAIIENGAVVNVTRVSDEDFATAQGWIVSETAKIGDSYDSQTGEFTTPTPDPVPVPTSVPTWAAKMALVEYDLYADAVTFIDGLSGKSSLKAKVQWDNKQTFTRDNALIQAFKTSQSLTETDLDNLFTYAAQVAQEG